MPTPVVPLDPYGPSAGRKHMTGKTPRPKTVTVDLHNHMRIEEAEVERIARAVLRHLEAAPQQPPYRPTPCLDTLEAAKQAAAYYAAR